MALDDNPALPCSRRQALSILAGATGAHACGNKPLAAARIQPMKEIPDAARITVARDPNWYLSVSGIAHSRGKLVYTYRKSDAHRATDTYILCARSDDGGLSWKDHREISHLSWEKDRACWVAPQLTALRDGRLVLVVDRGEKKNKDDWPMLSRWQQKDLGMSNHLFVSDDGGETWQGPHKIDDVGGEPGYILELSNGALVYTRTESQPTAMVKNPLPQWGAYYYRSVAVFSDDGGRSWPRTSIVADDPFYSDCEVGLAEYAPGRLIAVTRCGDAGSRFGQPSRLVYSDDFGKTWSKPALAPFYGHRAVVGQLASGKLLVVFRNAWGTTGSYALVFDPAEKFNYAPSSWIWDEARCRLREGVMEIESGEGPEQAVDFALYPAEDHESEVEIEAELMVRETDREGCLISPGVWIRFEASRVSLAGRPSDGFAMNTQQWHKYRLLRKGGEITIFVDGREKLRTPVGNEGQRFVHFGNRYAVKPLGGSGYHANCSFTLWRSLRARVKNPRDHSIDWHWNARQGFPDQFRRDRLVLLERNATFSHGNNGYGDWTQLPDGTVLVADYTSSSPAAARPFLRVYRVAEQDLVGAKP